MSTETQPFVVVFDGDGTRVLTQPPPGYKGSVVLIFIDNSLSVIDILHLLSTTVGSVLQNHGIATPLPPLPPPNGCTPMCNAFADAAQIIRQNTGWEIVQSIVVTDGEDNTSTVEPDTGLAGVDADRAKALKLSGALNVADLVHKAAGKYGVQLLICVGDSKEVAKAYASTKMCVAHIESLATPEQVCAVVRGAVRAARKGLQRARHNVITINDVDKLPKLGTQAAAMLDSLKTLAPRQSLNNNTLASKIKATIERLQRQTNMKAWNGDTPPDADIVADIARRMITDTAVGNDFEPSNMWKTCDELKTHKKNPITRKAVNSLLSQMARLKDQGVIETAKTTAKHGGAKYTVKAHA